ncbi:MAG: alpha/beta fold hydrolase, partial [Anaerolineae bacterium]|nr:alpha/beta fold hydrolase [Anaerolineae bacterium]
MNKKIIPLLTVVMLVISACAIGQTATPTSTTPAEPTASSPTAESPTAVPAMGSIVPLLEQLGGAPCEENPDFTCVAIQVPLDHFDAANTETIEVVFAVLPAYGERYGMFLQAFPGGPGGEGISTGFAGFHAPEIEEHYDIVFFDQRGVGLSNPLQCPQAYAADFLDYLTEVDLGGEEGYDLPEEQQDAIDDARVFVDGCVEEIGAQAANLAFYGTDQVAEDIESFRQVVGDEKFMFYGVSYGTSVVQHYAAVYPQHLSGMVLDGTLDLTLTGEQSAFSQEAAFDKVLVATLQACNADEACYADMGGDVLAAYDDLAARASANPIAYEFPLPDGSKVAREFTFNQLEYTTAYQMYSLSGRMLFLRALAAAVKGDMVPLARLQYQQLTMDPETYTYLGDPTFNDTMFLGVLCTDDSYFSGTT